MGGKGGGGLGGLKDKDMVEFDISSTRTCETAQDLYRIFDKATVLVLSGTVSIII